MTHEPDRPAGGGYATRTSVDISTMFVNKPLSWHVDAEADTLELHVDNLTYRVPLDDIRQALGAPPSPTARKSTRKSTG